MEFSQVYHQVLDASNPREACRQDPFRIDVLAQRLHAFVDSCERCAVSHALGLSSRLAPPCPRAPSSHWPAAMAPRTPFSAPTARSCSAPRAQAPTDRRLPPEKITWPSPPATT